MNIKKLYRLNTKEIRYILSTKNKFFLRGKILNINFIDQYPDKNYNKFGIGVSSKFHKKAVYRNIIRRIFYDLIYKQNLINKKIDGKYKKIYVSVKKDLVYDKLKSKEEIHRLLQKDIDKIFNFKFKKGTTLKSL